MTRRDATRDDALEMGRAAAAAAMRFFRGRLGIEFKSDESPVTQADRGVEAEVRKLIADRFPDHGIFGEEQGITGGDAHALWVIDPIDGTRSFISGHPLFGFLLAHLTGGTTRLAVVGMPAIGETFVAERGKGATINGERIEARTSGAAVPVAGISTLFLDAQERAEMEARASGKLDLVGIPRCAAEQYPRIVLGQNDLALFKRTLAWDHAAGVLFLNEAGGMACRYDGSPYLAASNEDGMLAAASPSMWDKAARILFR